MTGRPPVVHVLEAMGGGTARHLIDVTRHVPAFRHIAVVPSARSSALSDPAAHAELTAAGAELVVVGMRRDPVHPANLAALVVLRRLIRHRAVAIVHGHASVGGVLATSASRGLRLPRVWTPNGVDPSKVVRAGLRALMIGTERVVAVSRSEAAELVRAGLAPQDRLRTVPNGLDIAALPTPALDLRGRLGMPSAAVLVGTVGRLMRQKAPEVFVRAAGIVARARPDVHFVLVGSGELEHQVAALARAEGLSGRFHRVTLETGASAAIAEFDVYVSTARYEGGPYAPLEAMAAGVPVVLTDCVGNRDTVQDRVSGLLATVDDPASVAAAVLRLLGDPALAGRLAASGGERVRSLFTAQRMGAELTAVYEEMLG